MRNARRRKLFRDVLLTTTALVAALAGGGKGAAAGSSSGLSGFQVQSGGATLSTPSATKSVITQSTNKAIISWSAFGIPTGSTVQFIQPGSSSVALNRVTGGNVSQILGNLTANGQVWIVNPAGVFFGAGAQVDVAGLMATTSDIQNGNFLSGNYQFGIGSQNPNAGIVNQGTIRVAPGGSAVLSGAQVTNQGLIEAQLGSVVLAGAKTFTVDFQGDRLLSFQVTGAVDQRPNDASGAPANALVTNAGTVSAAGGTVLITARAAKNIIDNVINSSGIVEATSAKSVNGEIILDGGGTGLVTVSGSLDASGKGTGETGGTVKVLGEQVNLAAGASIDVSGDAGGGTALIGGNFHGAGPEQNAATTTVSAGARINASAISTGNGGKVAVWSDTATSFGGTVTATGGSFGGNGGFVETSGKQHLTVQASARVNTSAKFGSAGSWLMDPADATIGTAAGDINPGAISSALGSGDVIVETGGDTLAGTGAITVDASTASTLLYSSAHALDLLAVGSIFVNASVQNSGSGNINLVAGWNGSAGLSAGGPSQVFTPSNTAGGSVGTTFSPSALTTANFGIGGASVFINSVSATAPVAVGVASGTLTVLAHDVTLQGGSSAGASAQLGFNPAIGGSLPSTTGSVQITALGNVSVLASTVSGAFAMIGNGGYNAFANVTLTGNRTLSGNLGVNAGGAVLLQGGTGTGTGAFAQIGNGGYGLGHNDAITGTVSVGGSITVAAGGNISLVGGSGQADYVQIGHGGYGALRTATATGGANVSGGITAVAGGSLVLEGGTGNDAFAQIGHGGGRAFEQFTGNVTLSGAIDVTATGNLVMLGGSTASDAYAQIGHGGAQSFRGLGGSAGPDGAITVSVGGNATLTGGYGEDDYVQIGQGGGKQGKKAGAYGTPAGSFTNSGSVGVTVGLAGGVGTGTLSMTGGTGTSSNSYVLIGNGGNEFFGTATLSGGATLENSGNVSVSATRAILMQGGVAGDSYAQIGDGGTGPLGGHGGTSGTHVTIINTGNITVGVATTALAGTLSLAGGAGALSYAMIGDGGPMTPPGVTGTFATFADVINQGSIVVNVGVSTSSTALSILALTGGTGTTPLDLGNGTTSVPSCGAALAFCGGAFAQIGNGGAGAAPTTGTVQDIGDITVHVGNTSVGNISLTGGSNGAEITLGASNYAQIGNGGADGLFGATLTGTSVVSGNITVGATGNILMHAGTVSGSSGATFDAGYVQIGQLGAGFTASTDRTGGTVTAIGDITVTALGSIALTSGSASGSDHLRAAYAQIGQGGEGALVVGTIGATEFSSPTLSGNISISALAGATLDGSGGSYVQIGHGDAAFTPLGTTAQAAFVLTTGNIDLRTGGTLDVTGNVLLGHGIQENSVVHDHVIIEAADFLDSGHTGLAGILLGSINRDLFVSDVSVLATDSTKPLVVTGSISPGGPPDGTLSLASAGSLVIGGSITTHSNVNLIAGWDGSSGVPALGAGSFGAAAAEASVGASGNVTMTGAINTSGNPDFDFSGFAAGGAVSIRAGGTVSITPGAGTLAINTAGGDLTISTGAAGYGGSITVMAGAIDLGGGISSHGGAGGASGSGGNGGAIVLDPPGPVSIGATSGVSVDSNGGFGAAGGGNGGNISITGSTITLSGAIQSFGGAAIGASPTAAGGAGGAVSLTALGGFIQVGQGGLFNASIAAEGGDSVLGSGAGGAGGTIIAEAQTVTFSGGIYSFGGRSTFGGSTGAGGIGAPVTVTALSGPVSIGTSFRGQSIDSVGGFSALGSNAHGAAISIFGNGISIAGLVFSAGEGPTGIGSTAAGGAGGSIVLNAGAGSLSLGAGGFALISAGGYASGGKGAGGAINLAGSTVRFTSGSPVTIDPGSGTLSVSSSVGNPVSLVLLGNGPDVFGGDLNVGTLDLSSKSAGSVSVAGFVTAAALVTGTSPLSISLLHGGNLGDPNFQNTGTNTFAGNFIFSGGLTVGALSLAGNTSFDGTTNGVTLGTVHQGANTFIVIADSLTLNGDWIGTGPRFIAPFTFNAPITLGTSAAGFFLGQTELDHLSGGPAGDGTQVVIGSGLNGPITAAPLTFNDPLVLIGSNITLNGLSKSAGSLTLEAVQGVTLGQILGSVTLASGTGEFTWGGHDGTLTNTTINGDPGGTNSILNFVTLVPGSTPGPFIIDGFTQTVSGGGGGVQQSISQSGGSGAVANLLQTPPPNTGSNTPGPVILLIQPPSQGTGSTSQGQGSTDTGTTGTGTPADQAVPVVSNNDTGTPADTPSSSGNSKPTGVPNLFQHSNTGLGGGTGGGAGGTLENAPSL